MKKLVFVASALLLGCSGGYAELANKAIDSTTSNNSGGQQLAQILNGSRNIAESGTDAARFTLTIQDGLPTTNFKFKSLRITYYTGVTSGNCTNGPWDTKTVSDATGLQINLPRTMGLNSSSAGKLYTPGAFQLSSIACIRLQATGETSASQTVTTPDTSFPVTCSGTGNDAQCTVVSPTPVDMEFS